MNNLTGAGALGGSFWGLLFGLIFFVPLLGLAIGAGIGALTGSMSDVGIDDRFIKEVRDKVTPAHYREELEAHPPAVVAIASPRFKIVHPEGQKTVLNDFMIRHGYQYVRLRGVWFALRPDCYERARRNGLLE